MIKINEPPINSQNSSKKPEWLKVKLNTSSNFSEMKDLMKNCDYIPLKNTPMSTPRYLLTSCSRTEIPSFGLTATLFQDV